MTPMQADDIQSYLKAKIAALTPRIATDPALAPLLQALDNLTPFDIDRAREDPNRQNRRDLHADPVVTRALANLPAGTLPGTALLQLAPSLDWSAVFHGPEAPPALCTTMHSVALGYVPHEALQTGLHTGLFLLHPHLDYPLHSHIADEVYVCLSGHVRIRHGIHNHTIPLGPGDHSVTRSNIVHSLHTGDEPALLGYIWRGHLSAPNWWWHKDAKGVWLRTRWQWDDNHIWRSFETEPVTADIMAQANPA